MPAGLARTLALVDGVMLLYWAVTALVAFGLVAIPAEYLYKGYHDPLLVAWNWSFMPLDIGFALAGRQAAAGKPWRGLAAVSLALTGCAGGMAIAFWTLTHDFDPLWWIPNLILVAIPLVWLPRLVATA
jgi:hypothetical protein